MRIVRFVNYHDNYLQFKGYPTERYSTEVYPTKGGMMLIYSMSENVYFNDEDDKTVELYFQPKYTRKHGKRYKYIATGYEIKEYENVIRKFIDKTLG